MSLPSLTPSSGSLRIAAVVTASWFGAALVAGALGAFRTAPGAPPVAIGLAAGVPPLAAIVAVLRSSRFRAWVHALDLRFLTLLQTWRSAGFAFLALASVHALPGGFAVPAGVGDVTVGFTALFVAAFVVGRSDRLYRAWTALGVLDLVLAVTLGVLYSASPIGVLRGDLDTHVMATLPMSLIPAFGVPFTLAAHVLALTNLAGRRAERDHRATRPGPAFADVR
jgi:hypothetical protein